MPVSIYHNPRRGKSRQALESLRQRGVAPEIISLESSVGRGGVCVCGGAGQGVATQPYAAASVQSAPVRRLCRAMGLRLARTAAAQATAT